MRNDPWSVHKKSTWLSKNCPDWTRQTGARRIVYLFVLACIYWQVSERLSTEQFFLTLKYAGAHIALFIGLDPEGTMSIILSGKDYEVSREAVAYMLQLDAEWSLFCEGIVNGFGLAVLFLFALMAWSFGSTFIEKEHIKRELAQDSIEFEAGRTRDHKDVCLEPSKPEPSKPIPTTETEPQNSFEKPEVERLTKLLEEPENDFPVPEPELKEQSKEPSVTTPLRLPGRIYRDEN